MRTDSYGDVPNRNLEVMSMELLKKTHILGTIWDIVLLSWADSYAPLLWPYAPVFELEWGVGEAWMIAPSLLCGAQEKCLTSAMLPCCTFFLVSFQVNLFSVWPIRSCELEPKNTRWNATDIFVSQI